MNEDRYIEINNDLWHYVQDRDTFAKYDFNEVVDLLNSQNERIKELETELKNMTQRFEYELQMKFKYLSEVIDCRSSGDME